MRVRSERGWDPGAETRDGRVPLQLHRGEWDVGKNLGEATILPAWKVDGW